MTLAAGMRRLLELLLIAAAYAVTGAVGFCVAIPPGNVTAVWPPSGIAFAAVLLIGYRIWPGIWLGSFLVNGWFFTHVAGAPLAGLPAAAGIAAGSALQAVLGAYLLRRVLGSSGAFDGSLNAFKFVGISAASCVTAATFGVTSLCLAGSVPWAKYVYTWLTWWSGDLGGVLVLTPFAIAWHRRPDWFADRGRVGEFLGSMGALASVCAAIFGNICQLGARHYATGFLIIPLVLWSALRYGTAGVTSATMVIAGLALWGTHEGYGPFATGSLNESLLLLQAFVAVITLVGLSVAAIVAGWEESRRALERSEAVLRESEHDLRLLAEELDQRVEERTARLDQANRDLAAARDQAIDASNLKSAFVANISHELRTPLTGILATADLLETTDQTGEQKELTRVLKQSAQALLEIVNDLLDLSQLEAGKLSLENEPFNVIFVVQDSARLLAKAAGEKNLILTTMIDQRIPELVLGDHKRIRQALLNLIGNSIKFTESGTISVEASLEREDETTASIRFGVRDTGIGIAEDQRRFLFQPFSRLDHTSIRKHGGTGLGLSISKQLVEIMGGQIDFQSERNEGSYFWFTVPFGKPAQPAGPAAAPTGRKRASGKFSGKDVRVLVVEDHDLVRALVIKQLAHLGIEARPASSGQEALAAVRGASFHLILMDCQMPDIDGLEVTRTIRKFEEDLDRHTPIIALTAGAMTGDQEACLAAGMDDYLAKPVDIRQLSQKLDKWLKLPAD